MNSKSIDPARPAAYSALLSLWENGGMLNEAIFSKLPIDARARAFRMSREVLRNEAGFDRIIKNFASQKPYNPVRAMAHLALYELIIDKAAPHGVIDQWVEIAKSHQETQKSAGFLNALLRKTAQEPPKLVPTNQYGKRLRSHLQNEYPSSRLDAINKIQSHYPLTDIRLRMGENINQWAQRLDAQVIEGTHSLRLKNQAKVSELDGYQEGQWWVQDVAASAAVDAFDDLNNKSALDLCAAPGGKTLQLADRGANVTAVEISPSRAKRITENLKRTNLNAKLEIIDALEYQSEPFDCVLLDAPCSATGTIRRHPDLRFDDPLGRMDKLKTLQKLLLEKSWSLLKPSGELIYCTCSLLKEEGEAQIEDFVSNHKNAALEPITHPFTRETHEMLRIFPNDLDLESGCDGFFIAKLKKA